MYVLYFQQHFFFLGNNFGCSGFSVFKKEKMEEKNEVENDIIDINTKVEEKTVQCPATVMIYNLIEQVFLRQAFLNEDYYDEFALKSKQIYREQIQTIDSKFDDISNFLWNTSNLYQNYPKASGKLLRKSYEKYKKSFIVHTLGLPRMVSLPLGPRGIDVSDKQLRKAIAYSNAMDVFEGGPMVSYNGVDHNKAVAKLVYMYVEELVIKDRLKKFLAEKKELFYSDYYRRYEKNFYYIMNYFDLRSEQSEKANALMLESLSSKTVDREEYSF